MNKISFKTFLFHRYACLGFGLILICLKISTCEAVVINDNKDVVISRGLRHTSFDQEIITKAIERANLFLKKSSIQLSPSWSKAKEGNPQKNVVLVYLVEAQNEDMITPALVPKNCSCVFVIPKVLRYWTTNNSKGIGQMSIDRGYFMTYVLLHEAGHIAKHTPSGAFEDGTLNQLNIDPTKAKANEEDADEFAADLLQKSSRQTPANNTSLEANWVINELSKLSWNMQAFRTLDEFGAFAIGKPSVYFDNGYSHPNLAWRILRANNLIQQTEATQTLLNSFEDARQRGANPEPLYQRQD
jgi:hypothetical protein